MLKLLEFLEKPHKTTDVLLEEKEQVEGHKVKLWFLLLESLSWGLSLDYRMTLSYCSSSNVLLS